MARPLRAPVDTRRRLSAALACLGAIAVLIGVPLAYAGHVLSDTGQFTARATSLLGQPSVRALIAGRVADEAVTAEHVPTAAAPLLRRAVRVAIGSRTFRPIFTTAVGDLHRAVFENRSDVVTLRLAHIGRLVQDELRRLSPELAAQMPTVTARRITVISGGDLGQATRVARAVAGAHTVGVLLVIAGAIAFLLAVAEAAEWRRPEWRRGARYVGIAILVDGVLLVIGDMLARTLVVSHFAAGDDRRAAGAVWNTFLSGLRPLALLLAGAGAVVVVLMWALRPQRRPAPGVPLSAGAGAAPARARPEPRQSRRGR